MLLSLWERSLFTRTKALICIPVLTTTVSAFSVSWKTRKGDKRFKNRLGLAVFWGGFFLDRVGVCDDKIAGSVLIYFIL